MAGLFECMVELLSCFLGTCVTEFYVRIAVFLGGDGLAFSRLPEHLAFSSIDAGGHWHQVAWTIHNARDLLLEIRLQAIEWKVMFIEVVIEHLMFEDMISIRFRD